MHSAIVIDDGRSQTAAIDKVQHLKDVKTFADIIVASTRQAPTGCTACLWITSDSLVTALAQAASSAASKRALVISASMSTDSIDLSKIVPEIENRSVLEHIIFTTIKDGRSLPVPDISPESIVTSLSNSEIFPLLCVATSRYALSSVRHHQLESVTEFLTHALITSVSDGDTVRVSSTISPMVESEMWNNLTLLSNKAKSRCLRAAVDGLNIEELFPSHNWGLFSKESAAASYHSLAALFLRFDDPDSAAQCLNCSENLEESPRYFALQGLIHKAQGETLGAVANLVSSLQCYEARKDNQQGQHYLTFKPSNLEIIKTRMAQGLEALTRRDNVKAFESFSDAVFEFDSFYTEHGVKSPR